MLSDSVGICYAYSTNGYHRTQWLCNVLGFNPNLAYERGLPIDVANPENIISINTADDLPTDHELVVLSPKTAREVHPTVSLQNFIHPSRAIYFFGADTVWLSENELGTRTPDHIVYIPVVSDNERDEIYSFVIGGIVLYDRTIRRPWRF